VIECPRLRRRARERAKARGVKMGRIPKLTPHQQREAINRREAGEKFEGRRERSTWRRPTEPIFWSRIAVGDPRLSFARLRCRQRVYPETLGTQAGDGLKIAEVFDEAGLPPDCSASCPGWRRKSARPSSPTPVCVRMITFTGSTQTGRHLAVEAAKTLKRYTLEMGGRAR